MLAAVKWAMENDWHASYENRNPRPASPAILHTFLGSDGGRDYSAEALADSLFLIFSPDLKGESVWAQPGYRSLTRSGRGVQVAIAYDLCHDAWSGLKVPETFKTRDGQTHTVPAEFVGKPVNDLVSRKLFENAESLVKSGGPGWPGDHKTGNNWHAVRFGGAALQFLACDEPRETWKKHLDACIRGLAQHKKANLTVSTVSNGYNPEGIAYAQYPGYTTYPLLIALRRLEGIDLAKEIPGMQRELWSTYQGVLPIPRKGRVGTPGTNAPGLGLRPDFTDDHPVWEGEGTAALAFAVSPPEYLPGLKWLYRRLVGDIGDRTWDSASGNGLYSLLFYPDEIEERNPAEVWGLAWKDESFGMFLFRNRFQDSKDIVAQIVAKLRPTSGGHEGRDALGFRIMGLGVPWAVGSGRTTDMRGQTTIFPGDPEKLPEPPSGLVSSVVDSLLRESGDGYVVMAMELSDTGVKSQTRQFVADYSGRSGAPALFVVADRSENGRFWRLNTPDFNKIETAENQFTITAPEGQVLTARILHPASGVMPRTGSFKRGSPYPFREVGLVDKPDAVGTSAYTTQNKWVDFESADGRFVVAMTLQEKGAAAPAISANSPGGGRMEIHAGEQKIVLDGDRVEVAGWSKPKITVLSPEAGAAIPGAPAEILLRGTIEDPEGIESVTITPPGIAPIAAQIEGKTWTAKWQSPARGESILRIEARDKVGDTSEVGHTLRVFQSAPPVVALSPPAKEGVVVPQGSILLEGTVSDPDGRETKIEIVVGETVLASPPVENGKFQWEWSRVPVGRHQVRAVATDADGDRVFSDPVSVSATTAAGKGNVSDAASLWVGPYEPGARSNLEVVKGKGFHPVPGGGERWAIRETPDGSVLRVRPTERWDYANRTLWIIGSESARDWKLSWRMRMLSPLDESASALVLFGAGTAGPLAMDFQINNSSFVEDRRGRRGSGTRLWYLAQNENRNEIGWTHNPEIRKNREQTPAASGDYAGIPSAGWHEYRIEKTGDRLGVWRDNVEILAAESPWISTRGPVGFANDRLIGSEFEITDVHFEVKR